MNEVQKLLLDMIKDIDKKLQSDKITYFIDSGTAIGAVRHRGFIPWDDDIDICIFKKDVKKFVKSIKEMKGYYLQEPYSIDYHYMFYRIRKNNTTALEYKWESKRGHLGMFVDVFVIDDYPDSNIARIIYDMGVDLIVKIQEKAVCCIKETSRDVIWNSSLIMVKLINAALDIITKGSSSYVSQRTKFKNTNTYPKKWIEKISYYPFEDYKLPMYDGYDDLLRYRYGDYMTLPPIEERQGHHIKYFSKDINYKDYIANLKQQR